MKIKRLLLILVLGGLLQMGCSDDFVKYEPAYPDMKSDPLGGLLDFLGGGYIVDESLKTPEHYECLKKILERYKKEYKEKDGHIYIRRELSQNKNLLYNYTKKAEGMRKRGECGQNSQE